MRSFLAAWSIIISLFGRASVDTKMYLAGELIVVNYLELSILSYLMNSCWYFSRIYMIELDGFLKQCRDIGSIVSTMMKCFFLPRCAHTFIQSTVWTVQLRETGRFLAKTHPGHFHIKIGMTGCIYSPMKIPVYLK